WWSPAPPRRRGGKGRSWRTRGRPAAAPGTSPSPCAASSKPSGVALLAARRGPPLETGPLAATAMLLPSAAPPVRPRALGWGRGATGLRRLRPLPAPGRPPRRRPGRAGGACGPAPLRRGRDAVPGGRPLAGPDGDRRGRGEGVPDLAGE